MAVLNFKTILRTQMAVLNFKMIFAHSNGCIEL